MPRYMDGIVGVADAQYAVLALLGDAEVERGFGFVGQVQRIAPEEVALVSGALIRKGHPLPLRGGPVAHQGIIHEVAVLLEAVSEAQRSGFDHRE